MTEQLTNYPFFHETSTSTVRQGVRDHAAALFAHPLFSNHERLGEYFETYLSEAESLFTTEEKLRKKGVEGANLYYHSKEHAVYQTTYDAITLTRAVLARNDAMSSHLTAESAFAIPLGAMFHDVGYVYKTIFINQGETSNAIYLINSGSARIYRVTEDGEEVTLAVAGVGDVIGEMALLSAVPRSAYVQALTDITVFSLSGADFIKILREYPEIAITLLSSLAHKVRKADQQVEDVLTKKLIERTWLTLQMLSRYFENGEIRLSHEELSAIIGATRSKVSNALAVLEKEDKIEINHRKIVIK